MRFLVTLGQEIEIRVRRQNQPPESRADHRHRRLRTGREALLTCRWRRTRCSGELFQTLHFRSHVRNESHPIVGVPTF
jgi:hypothetical protein